MKQQPVPYQKILFVCINNRAEGEICCSRRASEPIAEALKARVKALGLSGRVRVSKSGCQDVCAKGPNVMVFPDYVWYHGVGQDDVEGIIHDTLRTLDSGGAGTAQRAEAGREDGGGKEQQNQSDQGDPVKGGLARRHPAQPRPDGQQQRP